MTEFDRCVTVYRKRFRLVNECLFSKSVVSSTWAIIPWRPDSSFPNFPGTVSTRVAGSPKTERQMSFRVELLEGDVITDEKNLIGNRRT